MSLGWLTKGFALFESDILTKLGVFFLIYRVLKILAIELRIPCVLVKTNFGLKCRLRTSAAIRNSLFLFLISKLRQERSNCICSWSLTHRVWCPLIIHSVLCHNYRHGFSVIVNTYLTSFRVRTQSTRHRWFVSTAKIDSGEWNLFGLWHNLWVVSHP